MDTELKKGQEDGKPEEIDAIADSLSKAADIESMQNEDNNMVTKANMDTKVIKFHTELKESDIYLDKKKTGTTFIMEDRRLAQHSSWRTFISGKHDEIKEGLMGLIEKAMLKEGLISWISLRGIGWTRAQTQLMG